MKSKKLRKKPVLNKQTVVNLNEAEMKILRGGQLPSNPTCPTHSIATECNL
jgi:hypothetical protein